MKTTQTLLAALILSTGMLTATGAHAMLQTRLGGQAVYDTELDLTWLANANANGLMSWSGVNTWVANLTVGGVSGWRLPTTLQPDATCEFQDGASYGHNCTGSEMGHLFYTELGGGAGEKISNIHNNNYNLFQNLESDYYWSSTVDAGNTNYVWQFDFWEGSQYSYDKVTDTLAMAVHSGDAFAVPVPAAAWLFGSGLIGLAGIARKRKAN